MSQSQWQLNEHLKMSDVEYASWITLLDERTGINIQDLRKSFLLTKLKVRMSELGFHEYKSYYTFVTDDMSGRVEWETLVDRLTVHETRFFRDVKALSLIKHTSLEKLNFENEIPKFHIWSVGCATGEEPYSLMMFIDKYMRDINQKCYLAVTASDISQDALAIGKKAVYHKNRFKNVPAEYIENYTEEVDARHFLVCESLRKRICFNRLNLIEIDTISVGKMEVIICQNVLIYYKRDKRVTILNQLVEHLEPGGILILGPGEIVDWQHAELEAVPWEGVLAFQRKASLCNDTQKTGYDA